MTLSRPRSEFVQALEARSTAGVASNAPAGVSTRSTPGCVATSILPSGVKASAVGAPTFATASSVKPAGSVAACVAATGPAIVAIAIAIAISSTCLCPALRLRFLSRLNAT